MWLFAKLLSLFQDGSRSTNLVHLLKESTSDTFLQRLVRRLPHGHVTLKNSHISAFNEVAYTKLEQQVHLLEGADDSRCTWRHCHQLTHGFQKHSYLCFWNCVTTKLRYAEDRPTKCKFRGCTTPGPSDVSAFW